MLGSIAEPKNSPRLPTPTMGLLTVTVKSVSHRNLKHSPGIGHQSSVTHRRYQLTVRVKDVSDKIEHIEESYKQLQDLPTTLTLRGGHLQKNCSDSSDVFLMIPGVNTNLSRTTCY